MSRGTSTALASWCSAERRSISSEIAGSRAGSPPTHWRVISPYVSPAWKSYQARRSLKGTQALAAVHRVG